VRPTDNGGLAFIMTDFYPTEIKSRIWMDNASASDRAQALKISSKTEAQS